MNRTRLLRPLVALLAAVLLTTTAVAASAVTPKAPRTYGSKIEPLASFQPQTACSPWARPGTQAFADLLLRTYPTTRSLGIVRSCRVGGTSEHKEGRAFDWGGLRASSAADRARVDSLMSWLLATDKDGHKYAMARRLGIQYVIWNKRIWGSYAASSGWRRYTGANPHTDHVHFSLSWAGARKETSFWTGSTGSTPPKPQPKPQPKPKVPPGIPEPRPMSALLKGTGSLTDETVIVPAVQRAGGLTRGALVARAQLSGRGGGHVAPYAPVDRPRRRRVQSLPVERVEAAALTAEHRPEGRPPRPLPRRPRPGCARRQHSPEHLRQRRVQYVPRGVQGSAQRPSSLAGMGSH
ncbi:MAG: hypothetical protein GEU96_22555 [Propionibacteriales bacterium]|nr:hypothetical protein [Propionibacteriales bacterium]